ncbi:MAG TPA: hypothetical protein VGS80_20485, partial [Ktedonobacterales bacterium]|nr:hypothetical protein [Ktedonobacterales bacterium]
MPFELTDPLGLCPAGTHAATQADISRILASAKSLTEQGISYGHTPPALDCTQYLAAAIRAAGWRAFPTATTSMIYNAVGAGKNFERASGGPQVGEVLLMDADDGAETHAVIVSSVAGGHVT